MSQISSSSIDSSSLPVDRFNGLRHTSHRIWSQANIDSLKPDQEALLAKHYDNLQTAWQGFSKRLGKKGVIVLDGKTPDLKLVFDTLHDASQKLQANTKDSAGGRVREKCRGLFEGIYAHKTVLKILPTDDKYFTLFAGALGTVMQVSGHVRIQDFHVADGQLPRLLSTMVKFGSRLKKLWPIFSMS